MSRHFYNPSMLTLKGNIYNSGPYHLFVFWDRSLNDKDGQDMWFSLLYNALHFQNYRLFLPFSQNILFAGNQLTSNCLGDANLYEEIHWTIFRANFFVNSIATTGSTPATKDTNGSIRM